MDQFGEDQALVALHKILYASKADQRVVTAANYTPSPTTA
jgi:hypothetical protein